MQRPDTDGAQPLSVSLALSSAFGIALGFLPKDSLAFYIVLAAAILLPTHLAGLALVGISFHLFGSFCSPVFHKLGAIVLTEPRLVGAWARLADWPLIPWTRCHNTVVMGAVVVSLVMFWPAFLLSLPVFGRVAPIAQQAIAGTAAYRWLVRGDTIRSETAQELPR